MKKINLEVLFANILFILVLFPYITILPSISDTQPYALILSIIFSFLYLLIKRSSIPMPLLVLLFLIPIAVILLLVLSQDYFSGIRSLTGYLSIFFITYAAYNSFSLVKPKLLVWAAWIWFIVGIIQMTFTKTFAEQILPRISTSEERGVTSLAVEPSFYAIVVIFMLLLNEVFNSQSIFKPRLYKFMFVFLTLQIIMSASGIGILFYIIFIVAKFISILLYLSFVKKIIGLSSMIIALLMFVVAFIWVPTLAESRAGYILTTSLTNPISLFYTDYSIIQRFSHIIVSGLSIFQNYGIGFGLGNWDYTVDTVVSNLPNSIQIMLYSQNAQLHGRIMSGWGALIFESGFFGLLPMFIFLYIMIKGLKIFNNNRKIKSLYLTSFIVIFTLMWMAVPISFPLFSYTLGIFTFLIYKYYYIQK